jgi:hypothetical protein
VIDNETLARAEEVRQIIADCDQRLARYQAALEAGTDPTLISHWIAEVNATRAAATAPAIMYKTECPRGESHHNPTTIRAGR